MDNLKQRFGRLVLANRRKKGLTQQQLADLCGVGLELVNRIERGRVGPRFTTIEKLAGGLGIDPAELFTPDLPKGGSKTRAMVNLISRLSALILPRFSGHPC